MAPRLCLNMIVRNEEAILERCLWSHVGVIDCFVIHDTGSTDQTLSVIERFSLDSGIPGQVTHGRFHDFSQARNEALDAARKSDQDFDYLLLADADMQLQVTNPFWRDELVDDVHRLIQRTVAGGLEYEYTRLVLRSSPYRYVGLTHEFISTGKTPSVVNGLMYLDHQSGSSRVEKHERDARLLEQAVAENPDESRWWFYLGNTYLEMGRLSDAMEAYRRRLDFPNFIDERFMSAYRLGLCLDGMGSHSEAYVHMLGVFDEYPHRAESLWWCAQQAQNKGLHRLAHVLASRGKTIPRPPPALFVESSVYDWRLDDIIAVSLYWMGEYEQSIMLCQELLDVVPDSQRPRIEANIQEGRDRLGSVGGDR